MRLQAVEYSWRFYDGVELSKNLITNSVCVHWAQGRGSLFRGVVLFPIIFRPTSGTFNKQGEYMTAFHCLELIWSKSGWIKLVHSLTWNQCHQVAVPVLRLCLCRLERRNQNKTSLGYNKDRYAWLHTFGACPISSHIPWTESSLC